MLTELSDAELTNPHTSIFGPADTEVPRPVITGRGARLNRAYCRGATMIGRDCSGELPDPLKITRRLVTPDPNSALGTSHW